MRIITTVKGQSILDIALETYGPLEAVPELIALNDLSNKMDLPTYVPQGEIDLAFSLLPGVEIIWDETSPLYDPETVKAICYDEEEGVTIRLATGVPSNYKIFSRIFSKIFH